MGEAAATDTAELTLAIETASQSVDRACDRQFGQLDAPQARFYTARYDEFRRRWVIDTDDFATTDGQTEGRYPRTYLDVFGRLTDLANLPGIVSDDPNRLPKLNTRVRFQSSTLR